MVIAKAALRLITENTELVFSPRPVSRSFAGV